jgi:hypothetical protein
MEGWKDGRTEGVVPIVHSSNHPLFHSSDLTRIRWGAISIRSGSFQYICEMPG